MEEQLAAVVGQASSLKDQVEVAQKEASKAKDLRLEVEDLTLKLNESKKSSQESFKRAEDAVNRLKVENESKTVLEKLVKALEEQIEQQTKATAIARNKWEQSREEYERKVEVAIVQSSTSDEQIQEMKRALQRKTLDSEILRKKVESLTKDLETARVSLNGLGEKLEKAENELKTKNEIFTQALREQAAEVNKHKELELRSEEKLRISKTELEKLRNTMPTLNAELEAKSNELEKAQQAVAKLNEKIRNFEAASTALKGTVEEMKAATAARTEELSNKEALLEGMQTKVTALEKTNENLTCEMSSQRLEYKAKIAGLEQKLISRNQEQDRKDNKQKEVDMQILQKTEKTLMEAKAEIAALETKLNQEKTTMQEEVEDHQAEIIGYEEAVDEKNKTIRNLTKELSALKARSSLTSAPRQMKDFGMLLEEDQTRLPTSI